MLLPVLLGLMAGRPTHGAAFVVLVGYLAVCALLYPVARFVYEGLVGFVMGAVYDKIRQRKKESYLNGVMDEMEAEIKKFHASSVSISSMAT